ncbi:hypothetical protein ACHQM5_006764 [Ranunculus cassubicifolius]
MPEYKRVSSAGAHILAFPFPAQGHMLPVLDLIHQLALLQSHLTITILVTPKNVPILTPLLATHPHIQTLVLPFPTHLSIPAGVENMKDLPPHAVTAMICAMGQLYNPLLEWFRSQRSPPTVILSDFFLGWTYKLACQLNIRRIVFSSSGAILLSVISELWRNMPEVPDDLNETISFSNIPHSPSYPWWHLSSIYRNYKKGDPDSEFIRNGLMANFDSWGVVCNTFSELESAYLGHVKKVVGHDRVWAVGPLMAHTIHKPIEKDGSSLRNKILSWLDTCSDNSVVYVSFGSQTVLTNKQTEELALGLEQSGAKFIWSVKAPTSVHVASEYGMIPDGFEERVAGKGIVIKGWVEQVLILRHRAIGAFLTHCGWNSVLESLVAGVPMLTWPFGADQFMDAKLLIEETGVAIKVCEGEKTIPNRSELAQALAISVSENGFAKERTRAGELSKAALSAVKEGGVSSLDLDDLVRNNLCYRPQKRKNR